MNVFLWLYLEKKNRRDMRAFSTNNSGVCCQRVSGQVRGRIADGGFCLR